ncbi:MAG: VOC family protein [Acidobacteria bacterium]|nr:VOC family protein [Acidobacteriota bacterium]
MDDPSGPVLVPRLLVEGGRRAIEYYERAFGAKRISVIEDPMGQGVLHAELRIGESLFQVADTMERESDPRSLGGTPVVLKLWCTDPDRMFSRALSEGAKVVVPIQDTAWGERFGEVEDPFGHIWSIAARTEDLEEEEIRRRVRDSAG